MVSVVHADASSSANVNLHLIILKIQQTSEGVYEVTSDMGSVFFLRSKYLTHVTRDRLVAVEHGLSYNDALFSDSEDLKPGMDGVFDNGDSEDILHAALLYSTEKLAMSYLARAEHCRAGLFRKLQKKDIDKKDINEVLDFLEEEGFLNDCRFAGAWLRTRYIDHAEGRRRLSAELALRGVNAQDAKQALDEFFSERDEHDICCRAYKKLLRTNQKLAPDKIHSSLCRLGFTNNTIRSVMKENLSILGK